MGQHATASPARITYCQCLHRTNRDASSWPGLAWLAPSQTARAPARSALGFSSPPELAGLQPCPARGSSHSIREHLRSRLASMHGPKDGHHAPAPAPKCPKRRTPNLEATCLPPVPPSLCTHCSMDGTHGCPSPAAFCSIICVVEGQPCHPSPAQAPREQPRQHGQPQGCY